MNLDFDMENANWVKRTDDTPVELGYVGEGAVVADKSQAKSAMLPEIRDGDGDGFIYDGTAGERPVSKFYKSGGVGDEDLYYELRRESNQIVNFVEEARMNRLGLHEDGMVRDQEVFDSVADALVTDAAGRSLTSKDSVALKYFSSLPDEFRQKVKKLAMGKVSDVLAANAYGPNSLKKFETSDLVNTSNQIVTSLDPDYKHTDYFQRELGKSLDREISIKANVRNLSVKDYVAQYDEKTIGFLQAALQPAEEKIGDIMDTPVALKEVNDRIAYLGSSKRQAELKAIQDVAMAETNESPAAFGRLMKKSVEESRKSANSLFVDMAEEAVIEADGNASGQRSDGQGSLDFDYETVDGGASMSAGDDSGSIGATSAVRVALKKKIAIDNGYRTVAEIERRGISYEALALAKNAVGVPGGRMHDIATSLAKSDIDFTRERIAATLANDGVLSEMLDAYGTTDFKAASDIFRNASADPARFDDGYDSTAYDRLVEANQYIESKIQESLDIDDANDVMRLRNRGGTSDGNPEISKAVLADIADNPMRFLHDGGQSVATQTIKRSISPEVMAAGIAATVNDSWAKSSTNGNINSVTMQKIVAMELGQASGVPEISAAGDRSEEKADVIVAEHGDVLKAVARATYENTQESLANQGIAEVALYRGARYRMNVDEGLGSRVDEGYKEAVDVLAARRSLPANSNTSGQHTASFDFENANNYYVTDDKIEGNPMSSWSSDFSTAHNFAGTSSDDEVGVMYSAIVPASSVYSTAATGPGCLIEAEFVVMPLAEDVPAKAVTPRRGSIPYDEQEYLSIVEKSGKVGGFAAN